MTTYCTKNQEMFKPNGKKINRGQYKDDRKLRITKDFKAAMIKCFNEQLQIHLKQNRKS